MIMTAFATMVSAEGTAPFTVTGNDVGETASDCSTWAAALAKVYEYGGGTIDFNSDYTMVSTDTNAGTAAIEITINGNGYTLTDTNAADVFKFVNGETVTVNKLTITSTWKRIEVAGGTQLTINGCTWVGKNINDEKGYIRTNSGTSFDTTVNVSDCTLWLYGGGTVFGNTSPSTRGLTVNLISTSINDPDAEGYSEHSGATIYGLTYQVRNVSISNSTICSGKRMLRGLSNANINIAGSSKLIQTNNTVEFFNVTGTGTTNVTIGKDACIINNGTKWYGISGSATERLNFNVTDLDFLKTSSDKGETTDEVDLNYAIPTLEDGASVRTTLSDNGMRFTAAIASDNQADEYGIIITPTTKTLTEISFTHSALTAASVKYAQVASMDNGFKKDDDGEKITYNAVIQGMKDPTKEYSARAYAKYTPEDNVNVTMYSDYSAENNARSIVYVAYKAVNDTSATYDADTYNCKIADGKYSPYSATQYSVLENKYAYRYDEATESYTAKKEPNRWSDNTTENGISVREIIIDTGKGGEDIEIVHISDLHLAWLNDIDIADKTIYYDKTLKETYEKRSMDFSKNSENAKKALNTFSNADQIVITGDIYDFLTNETVAQSFNYIFDGRENIMACLGNHDVVKAIGEENTYTAEEWQNIVDGRIGEIETTEKDYWTEGGEGDIFYSKKVLGNKVMLIQLDNGTTGEFREAQVNLLSADLELARSEGYSVLLFYHIPIATGNPEYKDIACDDKGQLDTKNFYNSKADTIGSYSSGASKDVYDLIVTHGDVIKGCFSGHVHSGFYTEIDAVDAEGMYTVIPQYVLNAMFYDGGYALRITVK